MHGKDIEIDFSISVKIAFELYEMEAKVMHINTSVCNRCKVQYEGAVKERMPKTLIFRRHFSPTPIDHQNSRSLSRFFHNSSYEIYPARPYCHWPFIELCYLNISSLQTSLCKSCMLYAKSRHKTR